MTTQKIYTVKDKKSDSYGQIFTMKTDGLAIRVMQNAVDNPNSEIAKYREEFSLYCVGEYDETSGLIKGYEDIKCIGQIADLTTTKE